MQRVDRARIGIGASGTGPVVLGPFVQQTLVVAQSRGTGHPEGIDLVSKGISQEDAQFNPLPFEGIAPAAGKHGVGGTYDDAVFVVDDAVPVEIVVFDITGPHAQFIQGRGDFTVVLVDAVELIQVEGTHFLPHLKCVIAVQGDDILVEQGGELVLVVREVQRAVPADRTQVEVSVQGEFETVVPHRADVAGQGGKARGGGHRPGIQQVVGVLQVGVEDDAETALQQGKVETEVILVGRLPGEVFVAVGGSGDTANAVVVGAGTDAGLPAVVADAVLVTGFTVAEAQFQICGRPLPEGFLGNVPAGRNTGEDAPAVGGRETRGTIGTDRSREHIAVFPG